MHPIREIETDTFMELACNAGSVIFDVRSESEHQAGHIPGALSLPLLNDEQRREIGICYKENGQQAAVEMGFELVGPHFHDKIQRARKMAGDRNILLYCWRGGLRSNIMAWLLNTSGMNVQLLRGGYKSYRHLALKQFSRPYRMLIIAGKTGTGKTEVLRMPHPEKIDTVDLEDIARHRGSAFGGLGHDPQPTQEQFENNLTHVLWRIPNDHSVLVEDESRMIGKLRVPDDFYNRMQHAPAIEIDLPEDVRIRQILKDYGHFPPGELEEKTKQIEKRMGPEQCKNAIEALRTGNMHDWCAELLRYYDKTYFFKQNQSHQKKLRRFSGSIDEIRTEIQTFLEQWANTD